MAAASQTAAAGGGSRFPFATRIWICALALTLGGELLPGNSAAMRYLGAAHINDKLLHYGGYTILALIPMIGFRQPAGALCASLMIFAGVALEFAQLLVPGRSFEFADMLANTLGVFTGMTIALLARRS